MPELPDITIYIEALQRRVLGEAMVRLRVASPFLLRTAVPPVQTLCGRKVIMLRRLGKRIVFGFEGDLWLVFHLMIAGRLHWLASCEGQGSAKPAAGRSARVAGRSALAEFEFTSGRLSLTEAGTRRRASLHLVQGEAALAALDPGGLEVLQSRLDEFARRLGSESHTVKRALTDPRLFSGIGNAYSDEILHRAGLSPVVLTRKLSDDQVSRLHRACRETLEDWTARLRTQTGDAFPEKVTAFRPEMAVHGRFGRPCPVCGSAVQRILYAENETNYCPRCQTGGKLLADRALSLLLKQDWPKTPEELEELRAANLSSPP